MDELKTLFGTEEKTKTKLYIQAIYYFVKMRDALIYYSIEYTKQYSKYYLNTVIR